MRKIEHIYISCCKKDVHLARICVASIRFWHPEVPISLVKDYTLGSFDTSDIEHYWHTSIFDTPKKKYGWSFIKLEPFFLAPQDRFLSLDSDIVFVGPLLDEFEENNADFIVHGDFRPSDQIASHYYHLEDIQKTLNPSFQYPGYIFNCGHIVGKGFALHRTDFDALVTWDTDFPELKHPTLFSHADQGIMNYVIHKKEQEKKISVSHIPFSIWSDSEKMNNLSLPDIKNKTSTHQKLIHYAGKKPLSIKMMPRYDILKFFEDYFYSKLPAGALKQKNDSFKRYFYFSTIDTLKKFTPQPIVNFIRKTI